MIDKLKGIFFTNTLRRWHFEDIVNESKMSRERVNHYLKILLKDNIITHIKLKGKMPYYSVNRESEKFRSEKMLYGLNLIQKSGLFEHIISLEDINTAILFGSFSRGDWDKSSDIDLFIYGNAKNFEKGKFESKLQRDIQIFSYNDAKKMKNDLDSKLIPNIAKGFNIKGNLEPFRVDINV